MGPDFCTAHVAQEMLSDQTSSNIVWLVVMLMFEAMAKLSHKPLFSDQS